MVYGITWYYLNLTLAVSKFQGSNLSNYLLCVTFTIYDENYELVLK